MKSNTSGLTDAELLAQQEQLFAASRARAAGVEPSPTEDMKPET